MSDAIKKDQEHQFTGVTIKIISVSNIKSQVDGNNVYVRIKCHQKIAQTKKKLNDQDNVVFDENFFYNTTQILDDDIAFELFQVSQGIGASKNIVPSNSRLANSKLSGSRIDAEGRYLGSTKVVQISRLRRQNQQKIYEIHSQQNKLVGKIAVSYDFKERQDIVGGIRCPNLSLRPDKFAKSPLTLQNKYATYKNLYSFLDGNQTTNCQFFPKKFYH